MTLPEELKKKYEIIELATPEYEEYKKYLEETNTETPASIEQFIDVAAFITAVVIPDRLNLSDKEQKLIATYHLHNRLMKVLDCIVDIAEKPKE